MRCSLPVLQEHPLGESNPMLLRNMDFGADGHSKTGIGKWKASTAIQEVSSRWNREQLSDP